MLVGGVSAAVGVGFVMFGNALWKGDRDSVAAMVIALFGAALTMVGLAAFCVVKFKIWWETG